MPATCLNDIDVVILAGGFGTRLRSVFSDRPKVLVPINGVPFLGCYLNWLRGFGARRIILALGYKAEMVQDYVKSREPDGLQIESFVESTPLGTGGAVRAVLPLVKSKTALVTNGDSLTCIDLCQFVEFHQRKCARLSMVLTHQPVVAASGLAETETNDLITSFTEKPQQQPERGGYISAGLYLMPREVIEEIPADRPVSIEKEVFPRHCGRGFYALKGEFPFIDIGTPESYVKAGEFFQRSGLST